jgi:hypothetical protein
VELRVDEKCLFESDIRGRIHRLGCPVSLSGGPRAFFRPHPIPYCLLRASTEINFTITTRDFYITHMITCQRFFSVQVIFFQGDFCLDAVAVPAFLAAALPGPPDHAIHRALLATGDRGILLAPRASGGWSLEARQRVAGVFGEGCEREGSPVPGVGLEPTWGASPEGF